MPTTSPPAAILPVALTQPSGLATPALLRVRKRPAAMTSRTTHRLRPAQSSRMRPRQRPRRQRAAPVSRQVPTQRPPKRRLTAAQKYSGEPISVNLKDVDLRDFFRLIHEISGLNVVVDPSVKGSLTIVLDDVPWDQALDIVLKNNDLESSSTVTSCASPPRTPCGRKRKKTGTCQGASGGGRRGDDHARAELRQGHDYGDHAQEVSVLARRYYRGRPFEHLIIRDIPSTCR